MRTRFIFSILNPGDTLPFHHQPLIAGLFKHLITGSKKYADFDQYTFSQLKGHSGHNTEGLIYNGHRVTIVLSTMDAGFAKELEKRIFTQEKIKIGNLFLTPVEVIYEDVRHFEIETKYLCMSSFFPFPYDPENVNMQVHIDPIEYDFSEALYENTTIRMEDSGLYSEEEINSFFSFQFIPDADYINRTVDEGKKISRYFKLKENTHSFQMRGYAFPFVLHAHPKVHEFIFNCGLGYGTFNGYGMLDVIEVQHVKPVSSIRKRVNVINL